MTMMAPYRSQAGPGRDGFGELLRAEWTKFRTVRGWVIGMILVVLATAGVGLLSHSECGSVMNGVQTTGCPAPPSGPGGEWVSDEYYFVHQPLTGNGTITVRVTSLTGLYSPKGATQASPGNATAGMVSGVQPWSKAGLIITAKTAQGSAYAAMMVTGGHGVRMQWNYVNDTPGMAGSVSAASPRWLRLTRVGDTVTGYDSADGAHWTQVGTATLKGLGSTVQAGLFAASPYYTVTTTSLGGSSGAGGPTLATAAFDHIGAPWPAASWTGTHVGGVGRFGNGDNMPVGYHQAGAALTVTGTGDIAPVIHGEGGGGKSLQDTLVGTFAGLIAVIVVAAMFVTAEYRRGLIRVTLSASPRRGRVLAAKAVVLAAISFVAGLVAVAITIPLGLHSLRSGGVPIASVPTGTEVRIVAGTAAVFAVAAVLALAIGTAARRSAMAVAAVIAAVFVPYLLGTVPGLLPAGVQEWIFRLTPAAGFSIQQAFPAYHQVTADYTAVNGYYPLAPWAGFAVLCAWALTGLILANRLLQRRDV
jgi:ABC-type transport system involved in multi-copper enzyme maturation permease subunit